MRASSRLRLGGDDIHEVMRRCVNEKISCSGVFRCLKRHGLNQLADLTPADPSQPFEQTTCGFIHIDIKHLSKLDGQVSYVFVAIDRVTRFVYVEVHEKRDAETAASFLKAFAKAFDYPIHTLLTDNGIEFTNRFAVKKPNKPENKPSGEHLFDKACQQLGIEHRLTRPFRPRTNGMVERFNRRLNAAFDRIPKQPTGHKHFKNHEERNAFVLNFAYNYNRTRLRCLNHLTPLLALHNHTKPYTRGNDETIEFASVLFRLDNPIRLFDFKMETRTGGLML